MNGARDILLKLVQGRDGADWIRSAYGWSMSPDNTIGICDWVGIECDGSFVTAIKLPKTKLSATIPYEFGDLSMLKELDLGGNNIHGEIPNSIFDLPHLEKLVLSDNEITGSIRCFASSVFNHLSLDSNYLYGVLPDNCPRGYNQNLIYYSLIRNKFHGKIPDFFSKIETLGTLSLSENRFSGTIPKSLGDSVKLKYLYLDNNNLQGTIPPSLGSGSSLLEIWLQENLLTGTVPAHIADLPGLFNFYIDGNKITGTIPSELCNKKINEDFFHGMPDEKDRDWCQSVACPVGTTALQGIYPCKECKKSFYNPYLGRLGSCIDLEERDILNTLYHAAGGEEWRDMNFPWNIDDPYHCGFTGIKCDNKENIINISLKGKGLKGKIPEELGFLEYLEHLDLSDNYLTGYLPSDLRFAPLEVLDFSGNQLKGIVPHSLCNRPINTNGEGGNYDCDYIICLQGSFSPTGRADAKSKCLSCDDNRMILGMKSCSKISNINNASSSFSTGYILFCVLIFATSLVITHIFYRKVIWKFKLDKMVTKEEIVELSHKNQVT